jgi:hypothetical protein
MFKEPLQHLRVAHLNTVMPAEAGIQLWWLGGWKESSFPAFAGMTAVGDDTVGWWRAGTGERAAPGCFGRRCGKASWWRDASRFDGRMGKGKAGFRLSPE